ncbi:TonB-dependent receptor [Roseateles amylovorans]|uniref:TonB-dependent receptor n=1 Tax=Roseateles amylovorans TaxID=2978473 RepID=A0ABY6AYG2_9BURK|nr:TonB-dependent receptor [Roseateles amylovorans]UXH76911.1 TonB-dependent receptor [Roseateles amylovorans]
MKTSHASRELFRVQPVAAGCMLLALMAGAAQAQVQAPAPAPSAAAATPAPREAEQKAAADKTLDTVTVTGIRRGIEAAISVKKNSDSIVEAVSAEDIGKLPDVSIAESIARLPGVSAQRAAGRAQVISVRGLSPDFATTLLNGRELVSTGDNRSVEFDQYPSELLSGVTIYKTPDAGLIGQGLSGTIDMLTVRPLDFGSRVVSLNARGQRNSLGGAGGKSGNGNRVSASYIDQFANRTIGVSIGFAHQETPVQEEQVGLYEPWKTLGTSGLPANLYTSEGIKALRRTGRTERDGVMATVEFRPNTMWTSVVDGFWSRAKQEDTANQFEMSMTWNGNGRPPIAWSGVGVNGNNSQTGGSVTNIYPLIRGMYNKRDDKIVAAGWNNKLRFESGVQLTADVNYSRATRNEVILENNTQLATSVPLDTVNLAFKSGDFSQIKAGLNYADPSQLFLQDTIYGSGYGKTPSVKDDLTGFKLVAKLPTSGMVSNWFSDVDVGLNYADRSKKKRQPEGNINLGPQGVTAIGSDLQYGLVDLGFAGLGSIPAWNVPAAVARYMSFLPTESLSYLIPKAWQVKEKATTAFLKGNIDATTFGLPMRGNIGLQVIRTDQSSQSNYFDGTANGGQGAVKPIEGGKTYTDYLPAMNLAWTLPGDQTVRFALAKQMARPRVEQLNAGIEFGVNSSTGEPGASGGNPALKPWRANAVDLSWEKYFGSKAYVAAAAYYKDLRSYIYKQTVDNYDFSSFVAGYVPQPGQPDAQLTGNFTAPYNGEGGKLKGLELSASLPFNLISKSLNGFGLTASASFNSSSIRIVDPDSANSVGSGPIALPGLSKRVYNLTAYYEIDGFEFRISQRKRSDFIGEIGNFNGARSLRYVVGESIVDAQIGYNFTDGPLKGLGLLAQVNNLTDEAYRTYAITKDRPLEYVKWGRTFLVGANYKF